MKPRVRFAPSPTGYLHIGGARTALFNWLYARHTGGTFILRIEDTDAARNSQEAVEVILSGLRWLGLDWDEGPLTADATGACKGDRGPYFQSQRKANYLARVEALLSRGLAYEHEGAVKFKMTREPILIPDLVVGDVLRPLTDREEIDPDFVIVRSDGQPVFHFVNIVDDLEMGVTHVIRGEDHLSNTAKHIALFRAFGIEPPKYAHIPLILNADGSKMSKRDRGASLATYLDEGFLPEAVDNYLCLLGWSPKDNLEKMPLAEVIERFDLPQILRHNAKFDFEKLVWLQGEYCRELSGDRFYELAVHAFAKAGVDTNQLDVHYVKAALDTCRGKIKTFSELPAYAGFYFKDEIEYDAESAKKDFVPENKPRLEKLRDAFAHAPAFNAESLEAALKETARTLGVKAGVLVHPCRLAVTGKTSGPSLYHLLQVLGKERVMARIEKALKRADFDTSVEDKTEFWFSLDSDWLPELRSFLINLGFVIPEDIIIRANQPQMGGERPKVNRRLRIVGTTVEKIGKALFDYLAGRECTLEVKSENETIEVIKQDSPQKVERFLHTHKGTTYTLKIKP
jgi:glutamyl-tRNA synthetase